MSLNAILGQKSAITQLKAILSCNAVPPALLFHGPKGVGKTLAAKKFVQALNCLDKEGQDAGYACGLCLNCIHTEKNTHPDTAVVDFAFQASLLEEEEAKQQHIKIETIREICCRAQQKASAAAWKVYILDGAETLLPAAANALLKFLEEPPGKTLWILTTAKKNSLLPTILSRCQAVYFNPLSDEIVEELLVQQSLPLNQAQALAALAAGSVDRALRVQTLAEQLAGIDPLDPLFPFALAKRLPKELHKARQDSALILDLLVEAAHRKWEKEARPQPREQLAAAIKRFFRHRKLIAQNVTPALVLQTALLETEALRLDIFPSEIYNSGI